MQSRPEHPRVACAYVPADSVTPQQLDPLGCSFVPLNREDAALAASKLSPGTLSCFTDDLRQNGLSRAGYVVWKWPW